MKPTKEQIEAEATKLFGFNSATERYKAWVEGYSAALSKPNELLEEVKMLRDELSETITILKSVDRNGIAKQIMDGNIIPLLLRHTEELTQIINKY